MFEQSMVLENSKKWSWTFLVATSLEIAAIVAAILVPLFFVAKPDRPAPPRPPIHYLPHVKLVRVEPSRIEKAPRTPAVPINRIPLAMATLHAPSRIPHGIANIANLEPVDIGPVAGSTNALPGGSGLFDSTAPLSPPAPPPSKPQSTSSNPLHVSQGVQEAKLIHQVMPRYPPLAVQTREFGTVHLVAVIGKDGHVQSLQVLDGPVFLRQAAVEAIKQWVYKPTLLNGQPVEVIAPIDVHFTLNN